MSSVQTIYSSLAVVELIKWFQFKKIYSSLESVEQIKSCQFKIYSSLTVVLLRKSCPKTVKVNQ